MEVLDINNFLTFKFKSETQELDNTTLNMLNSLFGSDMKKNKKVVKKNNLNILKNQKIQNKKEMITNKVNSILNKLSETNIDNLIIEFIQNINQIDIEHFEEVQKSFYVKIISEINFIKVYLQFLKMLGYLYQKVQNHNLAFFYSIVESKFKLDYTDHSIGADSKFSFVNEQDGEIKRINNLILIKNLVENKMLNTQIYDYCDKVILNQDIFLPDIYHWFGSKNRELSTGETDRIETLLKKKSIGSRETVLLESLINRKNKGAVVKTQNEFVKTQITDPISITGVKVPVSEKKIVESEKIKIDTLQLESENIIEEYLLVQSIDDVKYFIETRCVDAISKNKFCEYMLVKFFMENKENSDILVKLIKELVKSHILFKSNLSRGLLLVNNTWKDKQATFIKPTDKMKVILTTLKNIGITKGIEFIFENYKIQYNPDK